MIVFNGLHLFDARYLGTIIGVTKLTHTNHLLRGANAIVLRVGVWVRF